MLASKIAELLQRKQQLDIRRQATNSLSSGSYSMWLVEAVELLLQLALEEERKHRP